MFSALPESSSSRIADHALAPALEIRKPPSGKPTVVLVHGTMDRAASFDRVRRRLDDVATLAYDRRGYAGSLEVPVRHDPDGHAADLIALLDGHPTVVIGHSYGGLVALQAATAEPALIPAVGLYEPPVTWMPGWPRRDIPADPTETVERFFKQMVGEAVWNRLDDATRQQRLAEGPAVHADLVAADRLRTPDVCDLLAPVIVGHGDAGSPHFAAGATWLSEHFRDGEVAVIEGAGHGAHLSHPDSFATFVRRVLALAV